MTEPIRCNITTRSGSVDVEAHEGELLVEGGMVVRDYEGVFEIRRDHSSSTIVVRVPYGSDVTVGTVSGKVRLGGRLGSVRIATVSGKVRVDDVERIDVRSKSGSVEIGNCEGECRIVVTSAKVHIGRAQRVSIAGVSGVVTAEGIEGAEVKTVSGKVFLSTTGDARVSVHTVSGKVEIRVPREVQPATRLRSISGRVHCECPVGNDGEIAVKSVSGTIQVLCA